MLLFLGLKSFCLFKHLFVVFVFVKGTLSQVCLIVFYHLVNQHVSFLEGKRLQPFQPLQPFYYLPCPPPADDRRRHLDNELYQLVHHVAVGLLVHFRFFSLVQRAHKVRHKDVLNILVFLNPKLYSLLQLYELALVLEYHLSPGILHFSDEESLHVAIDFLGVEEVYGESFELATLVLTGPKDMVKLKVLGHLNLLADSLLPLLLALGY